MAGIFDEASAFDDGNYAVIAQLAVILICYCLWVLHECDLYMSEPTIQSIKKNFYIATIYLSKADSVRSVWEIVHREGGQKNTVKYCKNAV